MTTGVSGRRRRSGVSVSSPAISGDPVEQLDLIVEIVHHVNRALARTVLGRDELLAIGGLLIQINAALLAFNDLLSAPVHHRDRRRLRRTDAATGLLRDCRDGVLAAYTSARALHADLRRCPRTGAHRGNG